MIDIQQIIKNKITRDDGWGKDDQSLERFHPSTAGFCERQMFLSKIGGKVFDEKILGSMECGTAIHRHIQKFPEIIESCDIEQSVTLLIPDSPCYFKGNADIVTKERDLLVDLKTIKFITYVKKEPMDTHIAQLQVYMAGLNIKKGEIIYIQKTDLETVKHEINYDKESLKPIFDKVKKVYDELLKWKIKGEYDYIPFEKCDCYQCKSEKLDEQLQENLSDE